MTSCKMRRDGGVAGGIAVFIPPADQPRMKPILFLTIFLTHVAIGGTRVAAAEYYVAPGGEDAWSGQLSEPNAGRTDGPWRTLKQAAARVTAGDICYLRAGTSTPARECPPGLQSTN